MNQPSMNPQNNGPTPTTRFGPLRFGRVFGVPLYVSPSWLVIAAFVTLTFGGLFEDAVDDIDSTTAHLLALAYAILVAVCVLLHELGHTLVALALRLRVRRVVIFLLGGASEIDPEPERPRDELLVSVAGPLASAVLAALCWWARDFATDSTAIAVELDLLIWGNLAIAIFNALPGLPLDGGRVLRAAIWGLGATRLAATRIASVIGRGLAVLVALSGLLVRDGAWGFISVATSFMLGAFLWFAASQNLLAARVAERLPFVRLADLVRPAIRVLATVPITEALRQATQACVGEVLVIDSADVPQAIVDDTLVARIPAEQRPWLNVAAVARPVQPQTTLPVRLTGAMLVQTCQRWPAPRYLVVDDEERAIGVLSALDLRNALSGRPSTSRA